jgi:hypothetical protein
MTSTNKTTIQTAAALGREAYEAGRSRVAAFDETMMAMLDTLPDNLRIPALKAWIQGWDLANLAAVTS